MPAGSAFTGGSGVRCPAGREVHAARHDVRRGVGDRGVRRDAGHRRCPAGSRPFLGFTRLPTRGAPRRPRLILDEIQFAPELVPAIKRRVDRLAVPGQFLLSGSQQWQVMKHLAESLAGRAAFVDLEGFTLAELAGKGGRPPWLAAFLLIPRCLSQATGRACPSRAPLRSRCSGDSCLGCRGGPMRRWTPGLPAMCGLTSSVMLARSATFTTGLNLADSYGWPPHILARRSTRPSSDARSDSRRKRFAAGMPRWPLRFSGVSCRHSTRTR